MFVGGSNVVIHAMACGLGSHRARRAGTNLCSADLIAQLDHEQARRIKTECLLQQLLAARSGRRSEQLSDDQLALFAAELKAQGVELGADESQKQGVSGDDPLRRRCQTRGPSRMAAVRFQDI
jgi:hypothetical protein